MFVQKRCHGASEALCTNCAVIVGEVFGWEGELGVDVFEEVVMHQCVFGNPNVHVAVGFGCGTPWVL